MASTKVKSIRLTDDEWSQLQTIADGIGSSLSRAVANLITEYGAVTGKTSSETASGYTPVTDETAFETAAEGPSPIGGKALDALAEQLKVKDDQIARLMDALAASQDATRAAQALHAVEKSPKEMEARSGHFRALWGRITGAR